MTSLDTDIRDHPEYDYRDAFDEVQHLLHKQVFGNGFWDHAHIPSYIDGPDRAIALPNPSIEMEKLMLITSEVAEAAEQMRIEGWRNNLRYHREDGKPEGVGPELADAAIRIFDLAEWLGISLIDEIVHKDEFNRTRPYKHNKLA